MLWSVLALSRPVLHDEENRPDPKGLVFETKLERWGIEPALSRESRADFAFAELALPKEVPSVGVAVPGLNGLVEGVGREVFGRSEGWDPIPGSEPAGENLDGKVPALALLVADAWLLEASALVGALKSGKVSLFGDSGIVSLSGVECPLVGGPHICGL